MGNKAFAAYNAGENLKKYDIPERDLLPEEVKIRISHCGICHSDIHLIDDDWKISRFPLVPGHEVIGIIIEKGTDVPGCEIGQRVGVGWQSGSCGHCEWCRSGSENLCREREATCVNRPGGFAEYLIVNHRFAFPVPEELSSGKAAPLMCAGITVYNPMRFYGLQPSMKVGIVGIGGLGHLAIQFARALGCEVTAFSGTPDKEQEVRELGAKRLVLTSDSERISRLSHSLDFILSTVYVPMDWAAYLKVLRPKGQLIFVGTSNSLKVPMHMLLPMKSIGGSDVGGGPMIREMLQFAAQHRIESVTETYPMAEVNQAVNRVRHGHARYRVVLSNEPEERR